MQFVIDGNNLVYIHARVAGPALGREPLCRLVDRWASGANADVVVVFDGPPPPSGVWEQMRGRRLDVRFSGLRKADDMIEDIVEGAASPANLCVVTSDRGPGSAARHRGCRWMKCEEFSTMLTQRAADRRPPPAPLEKPTGLAPGEADAWLREFGLRPDDDDH